MPMDLGEYLDRFPKALEDKYGERYEKGFADIAGRFKKVESGTRLLTIADVKEIFSTDLPFVRDWTKPDFNDLKGHMDGRDHKVEVLIQQLGPRGYDLPLITEILGCFRELSLTALVLHHVYPQRFAMCSHHLASQLHITGPTVPTYYIEYCKELEEWSKRKWPTPHKLTVVDAEFALWTWYRLSYHSRSKEERKKHQRNFFKDPWVQERRAHRLARSLDGIGKLDLARSYLDVDPTVAAMIAWRELEIEMRRIVRTRDADAAEKCNFMGLLNKLPPDAFSRNLTKNDLESLWSRRKYVVHLGEEIAEERASRREAAATVLNGVVEFIVRNRDGTRFSGSPESARV